MAEFWLDSGYRLLDRTVEGELKVTDDFLRAYLMRPELEPVEDSCDKERALHERLLVDPTQKFSNSDIDLLDDPDVRDNYRILMEFWKILLNAGTLEKCYMQIFQSGNNKTPPLFINQLVQIILRNILDGVSDALMVRSAELLFREQKVSTNEGLILSADAETVSLLAENSGFGTLGQLIVEAGSNLRSMEMDILEDTNKDSYWDRSNRFDTAIGLNTPGKAIDSLCSVFERWIFHFLKIEVSIVPMTEIVDERWLWHIGLDSESTDILNTLYNGLTLEEEIKMRLLALFKMEVKDKEMVNSNVAEHPVYLAMAMDQSNLLRLKPQNILMNFPLANRI